MDVKRERVEAFLDQEAMCDDMSDGDLTPELEAQMQREEEAQDFLTDNEV